MKKKHSYSELSDQQCIDCRAFLKKSLLENKPDAIRCYKCFMAKKGKKIGVKPKSVPEIIKKEAPKEKEHKSKYQLKQEKKAAGNYAGSPFKPINQ